MKWASQLNLFITEVYDVASEDLTTLEIYDGDFIISLLPAAHDK